MQFKWSHADVIYAASVCYPDELMEGIADKLKFCKKGTRMISLNYVPERDYLIEYANFTA